MDAAVWRVAATAGEKSRLAEPGMLKVGAAAGVVWMAARHKDQIRQALVAGLRSVHGALAQLLAHTDTSFHDRDGQEDGRSSRARGDNALRESPSPRLPVLHMRYDAPLSFWEPERPPSGWDTTKEGRKPRALYADRRHEQRRSAGGLGWEQGGRGWG